jgi:hypothetical protein
MLAFEAREEEAVVEHSVAVAEERDGVAAAAVVAECWPYRHFLRSMFLTLLAMPTITDQTSNTKPMAMLKK